MIKLKDLLKESSPGFENRQFGDPLPTLEDIAKKHQEKNGEQINEYIDLHDPIKDVKGHFEQFEKDMDYKRGGSFDGDSGEYHGFEGGDDNLYEKRYKQLTAWEKKVKKALDGLMKDYVKAWK